MGLAHFASHKKDVKSFHLRLESPKGSRSTFSAELNEMNEIPNENCFFENSHNMIWYMRDFYFTISPSFLGKKRAQLRIFIIIQIKHRPMANECLNVLAYEVKSMKREEK